MTFDVAIVGGGPAGAACAAFSAAAGLRVLLLERETFPREKVCGDCINPSCWPVLKRLGLSDAVRNSPHGRLDTVEFIAIDGTVARVELPGGADAEIAVKRSIFDALLLARAGACGAAIQERATLSALQRNNDGGWALSANGGAFQARLLVAADGRNSTVARLCGVASRPQRERVALQSHIPLPPGFGNRIVLELRPEGYSGQAPVNEEQLNLCLVSRSGGIDSLKQWAKRKFSISPNHNWRTITPLTRAPLGPARDNLIFIGDAARVVEPFTGEGIYYALRSGELAAEALIKISQGADQPSAFDEFRKAHAAMYQGRLWINRLARAAVLAPRVASTFVHLARRQPSLLRLLTSNIVRTPTR